MKFLFSVILFTWVAFINATNAQSTVTHSSITFEVKNMGINTTGSIGSLQANVHFNPADLASSNMDASIDVNTINTDNSSRDEHLRSEDFFDVSHYPKITLKSVSFKHKSGNKYTGIFNLTIKAKTKLIEMPFIYADKGNTGAFSGTFTINRVDFGVGSSSMVLADDVLVKIDTEISK